MLEQLELFNKFKKKKMKTTTNPTTYDGGYLFMPTANPLVFDILHCKINFAQYSTNTKELIFKNANTSLTLEQLTQLIAACEEIQKTAVAAKA